MNALVVFGRSGGEISGPMKPAFGPEKYQYRDRLIIRFCPLIAAWSANCPLFQSDVADVCGGTPRMSIWGHTRCLGMETKRQQAAALQTLRACQRPMHPRQRVKEHRDQRRDRIRRYGDRHVVGSERRGLRFGAGVKGWRTTSGTRRLSVFRVNAEL